jgi:alanine-glyoxylate transaminase/serine-glyoxylate transaminase/serine-pyruvate transaminase
MSYKSGRHFLQIPGPTNVPDRVLRAISQATIDHRGPEFSQLALEVFPGLQKVFRTTGTVVIYPSSGTGAWEASLVNTLSPGDKVLMFETGYFAALWRNVALKLGLEVDFVPGDWRHGVDPTVVEKKLAADRDRKIKAVTVVHNETSTGATSRVHDVRKAIDRANHPALLMVDTISSLTRRQQTCSTACVKRCECSSRKGSTVSSPGTTVMPRLPGVRFARGGLKFSV